MGTGDSPRIRLTRAGEKNALHFGPDVTVRVDGAGLHELRALLTAQDDLDAVRQRARQLLSDFFDDVEPDMAAWQDRNAALADTAHADGYRLAVSDLEPDQDAADLGLVLQRHLGTLRELVTRYDKLPETASGIPLYPGEWTGQLLLAVRALLAEA
jgi:hypothetical protein